MGGGGEKTEKATSKKRRDARKKGQVRRSTEVNVAFCSIIMFGLLFFIWETYTDQLVGVLMEFLGPQSLSRAFDGMSTNEVVALLNRIMVKIATIMLPIMAVAMVAGVAANILQFGFLFTTENLGMKLNRISPLSGFKRMFSSRTLVELLKSILKIIILGFIAYNEYLKLLDGFRNYIGLDLYTTFIQIMRDAFMLALRMCLALVVIAAADFFFQWWKFEKDLKMTKQEVKDEYKMMEGDPQIKGKIKQKQRQMSMMRMMSRVPEADVVITNPTHYAVALKYDDKVRAAPVVIAKGQDYIARKIREVAQENNIQIVENPPIAQALYAMCEVDDEIPADLYQAVADILVFVYKQKGKIR